MNDALPVVMKGMSAGAYGTWALVGLILLAGIVKAALAVWPKMKKAQLDENGLALKAWSDMSERHEREIHDCRAECDKFRKELDEERRDRRRTEDELRATIKAMQEEINGLHRQMIQNSHSTVQELPRLIKGVRP